MRPFPLGTAECMILEEALTSRLWRITMNRVSLDVADASVRAFIQALPIQAEGLELESQGRVLCTVLPPGVLSEPDRAVVLRPPFSSHLKMWWAITAERPFFRCGGVRSRYPC